MRTFLKKITSLTPIAAGAAAGMIVLGVVSIVGGSYDHQVVHNQLAPQKIFFPKPAEYADLKKYEGQQVLTGVQAKAYAEDQIAPDEAKVAGGKTYSQVSDEWIAGGMKNPTLAGERTTLFMGDTLQGLLLNAWGWGQVGGIAVIAGILLLIFGALLFLLPVLNWWLSARPEVKRSSAPLVSPAVQPGASA
jgi:4-hydroxybenzoate polyprenyltransferase